MIQKELYAAQELTLEKTDSSSKYDPMCLKWRPTAVKCHMLCLTKEADRKRRDTPTFFTTQQLI